MIASEFETIDKAITKIFSNYRFNFGRLISYSKTAYKQANPNNIVFFNANIITKERGLVWCGDLDITKDEELLRKVSKEINEELYVLKEMDGKVNNVSEVLIEELIGKAVYVIRG